MPVLAVDDLPTLSALEGAGYALADVLDAPGSRTTAELTASSAPFRTLSEAVATATAELRAEMKANGRPLREVTAENIGRVMDMRWLASPLARFRLVGVVNRIDKRDFGQPAGTCGEIRLIYRLGSRFEGSKKGKLYSSRLPVSLNVVFEMLGDCRETAASFVPLGDVTDVAAWLAAGPLNPARVRLKQVELNVQIVRFPSGLETEFGGQAVYLMRVFAASRTGGQLLLTPKPLENTPDVARIEADAALKVEMVTYLRDHAPEVDEGTVVLPDKFLSFKALSHSTYGPLRTANRPFAVLLKPEDFDGAEAAGFRVLKTTRGMIERLDQMSCMGSYQSNGTAGFHFFGLDDDETSPLAADCADAAGQLGIVRGGVGTEMPENLSEAGGRGGDIVHQPCFVAVAAHVTHLDRLAHDLAHELGREDQRIGLHAEKRGVAGEDIGYPDAEIATGYLVIEAITERLSDPARHLARAVDDGNVELEARDERVGLLAFRGFSLGDAAIYDLGQRFVVEEPRPIAHWRSAIHVAVNRYSQPQNKSKLRSTKTASPTR